MAGDGEGGMSQRRRLPIGAEVQRGGVHFRVCAPARSEVAVVVGGRAHPLGREATGHFSGLVSGAAAGATYRFRLDGQREIPDPASRYQPEGPHGPSVVIDPAAFEWNDAGWRGVRREGLVVQEIHVGTFTREGTFAAAAEELARLRDIGVTAIELMALAEFPGAFGWGYDGVDLFAPSHLYGTPDDLRRLVDRAHSLGMGVIADVVYNHFGPDGCYLRELSPDYFTRRYENAWGEAINYDGEGSAPARELVVANAGYWIDELHMDGLRLDATQAIHDASPRSIFAEISVHARAAAGDRSIVLIAESESQDARLLRPIERGGYGLDAAWNDDFHHSAMVAATGRRESYYRDYRGSPQELIGAIKRGYLFQGQRSDFQSKPRGTPALDLPAAAFVHYIEDHDQVANSFDGRRLRACTTPGRHRALVALLLLGPQTPMLFQGEEAGALAPFLFFADHQPELAAAVRKGRTEELSRFPSIADAAARVPLADPEARATFERCKLDPAARDPRVEALYRDLLRLRREDRAFAQQRADRIDGAVVGPEAFVLRYLCETGDRLLVVNLGAEEQLRTIAEPLVAPADGGGWHTIWSSEDPSYGGAGAAPMFSDSGLHIGAHQAAVLAPAGDQRTRTSRA
jgi:maltooligosyltrehalose trehalohydrolase